MDPREIIEQSRQQRQQKAVEQARVADARKGATFAAGQDNNTGQPLTRVIGGAAVPMMSLSNVQPEVGQQGRTDGRGFDVGNRRQLGFGSRRQAAIPGEVKHLVFWRLTFDEELKLQFVLITPSGKFSVIHETAASQTQTISFEGEQLTSEKPLGIYSSLNDFPPLNAYGFRTQPPNSFAYGHTASGHRIFCGNEKQAKLIISFVVAYTPGLNMVPSVHRVFEWVYNLHSKTLISKKECIYTSLTIGPNTTYQFVSGSSDIYNSFYCGAGARIPYTISGVNGYELAFSGSPAPNAVPLVRDGGLTLWAEVVQITATEFGQTFYFVENSTVFPVKGAIGSQVFTENNSVIISFMSGEQHYSIARSGNKIYLYCVGGKRSTDSQANSKYFLFEEQGRTRVRMFAIEFLFDSNTSSYIFDEATFGDSAFGNVPDSLYWHPPQSDYSVLFDYDFNRLQSTINTPIVEEPLPNVFVKKYEFVGAVFAPTTDVVFKPI
jgi:hypothetical protein